LRQQTLPKEMIALPDYKRSDNPLEGDRLTDRQSSFR